MIWRNLLATPASFTPITTSGYPHSLEATEAATPKRWLNTSNAAKMLSLFLHRYGNTQAKVQQVCAMRQNWPTRNTGVAVAGLRRHQHQM